MPFEIIRHQENLLSRETHLEKHPGGGGIHILLTYPNHYRAAMSNLGFQRIFSIITKTPGFYCDRTFLPDPSLMRLFNRSRRTLMGWQSEKPAQEFDLLAFSISYEPDYLNVLKMLKLAGIPLRRQHRDDSHPLIIAGGAAVTLNPEVMADFIDLFVAGEGEMTVPLLLEAIKQYGSSGRQSLLEATAQIPGVYVPSLYEVSYDSRGYILQVTTMGDAPYPVPMSCGPSGDYLASSGILSPDTEFADTFLVEISRGCPCNCAFCCVGRIAAPYRTASLENVFSRIHRGLQATNRVGILGAAVGSHPQLGEILDYLLDREAHVSFASLRADMLPDDILAKIHRLGQNLLTLAPETGADSLRKSIGKGMTNERILSTVERATAAGFSQVRLYLMTGLPGETDSDAVQSADLIGQVYQRARKTGARVMVSINQFVPKPRTPLERSSMAPDSIVARRLEIIQKPHYNNPGIRFKVESPGEQLLQAFLCRSGRRAGQILEEIYQKTPARAVSAIVRHMKSENATPKLIFKKIPEDAVPPWRIISP